MISRHPLTTQERMHRDTNPTLISLVVPVFNEAETVEIFVARVQAVFKQEANLAIEIVFVNDGSSDETLIKLVQLKSIDSSIRIVDLSRNFGKEAALSAGLKVAQGNLVVPIDVDLQDPPELILKMLDEWRLGYDVVLGKRVNRDSDSWAKRKSASLFYRIHNLLSDTKVPENVGDFRLMDRAVVDAINDLGETRRFMKGLFAWVGFRTSVVEYTRPERIAGTSKFNGWKLWNFALEGLTSFSTAPMRIWTYLGAFVAGISFIFAAYMILKVMVYGVDVPGYASLVVIVTFLGGLQLIGIGVIGEYLGRTYMETKKRPVYLIRHIY